MISAENLVKRDVMQATLFVLRVDVRRFLYRLRWRAVAKMRAEVSKAAAAETVSTVYWLQGVTIAWMMAECGLSLWAAWKARSVALLTFGGDSLIELLSAAVVLMSVLPSFPLSRERAARWAGILLFGLAVAIALMAAMALVRGAQPEPSCLGIGVSAAALVVMPVLAWWKRRTAMGMGNAALAADAVQSATCAYLAAITLVSLAMNALLRIRWIDPVGALVALPVLIVEGRRAMRGDACTCCC